MPALATLLESLTVVPAPSAAPASPFLSVLIPALNEERTLAVVLDEILAVGEDLEIVLVDDGSSDGTWEVMQRYARRDRVHAFRHPARRGKGAAVKTALAHARGDYIIIQDADLEYSPSEFPQLLEPIRRGRASVVYGMRTFASHSAYSLWYVLGNKVICMVTDLLYNCFLRDVLTCYKVMPREVALQLDLRAPGFDFDPEVTAKLLRLGHRIYEVPITYAARTRDEGKKVTPTDGVHALLTLMRYRMWRPAGRSR